MPSPPSPPPPRPSPAELAEEEARLCAEVLRLTEDLRARVEAGDDDIEPLATARAHVVQALSALAPIEEADDPTERRQVADRRRASAEAIRRVLALDREIGEVLEARLAQVRRELTAVGQRRDALIRYRGAPPAGPVYADRIG